MPSPPGHEPIYDALCLVCLKTVRDGDALVHFPFEDHYVTICCPLCYEAFKLDPQSYLARKVPPRQDNPPMF